jgi:fibronectin-binding autotransporter adhesin
MALAIASATAIVSLSDLNSANASVRTFTATAAGSSWATAANWSGAAVPTATDSAELPDGGSIALTGAQSIQTFAFTGAAARVVGNNAATGGSSLQLNGNSTTPLINVTSTGNFTLNGANIGGGSGPMSLLLNASGDFNVVNAATTLTVTTAIGEINGVRALSINGNGGAGTIILGGTDSFSGGIKVAGGVLQLNTALSTNGTTPNKISFTGGMLELNNGPTIGGLSSAGGAGIIEALGANAMVIAQDDNETYTGLLRNGAGTLTVTKAGPGMLTLSGSGNTFTGQLAVVGGTLMADHTGSTARQFGNGSNPLVMQGGAIAMNGNATVGGPEDHEGFATTSLNGSDNVFSVTPGANLTSMDLAAISHNPTATADFRVNGAGQGQITTSSTNDSTGILGPWATYLGDDWATVNGTNQIVAFTGYAFKNDPSTWLATDHVSYSGSNADVSAPTTITSLRFDPSIADLQLAHVLNIDSGATLTVGDGGILSTSRVTNSTINGPGAITSGTSTLFIHTNGGSTIVNAPVTNNTSGSVTVVHSGPGFYQPMATNTYSGDTVVNSGSILVDANDGATLTNKGAAGALGAGNNIQLNGGTLAIRADSSPVSTDRDIQLSGVAGLDVSGTATFSGLISDPTIKGTLNLDGPGVVALTNAANSYQGGTRINGGVLMLTNDALGNGSGSVVLNGGTLSIDGSMSFTTGRTLVSNLPVLPINVDGTNTGSMGTGNTSGKILTTGTLLKSGTGTLTLGLNVVNTGNKVLITGGNLAIAADAELGAVPATLVPDAVELQGGTLRFFSSGTQGLSLNANRGVQVDAAGGTLDFSYSSGVPFIQYPISGTGRLIKNGTSTVSSNSSHSFSGGLDIVEGRWNVTVPGAAGTGSIIMEGGSALASPKDGNGQITPLAQLGIGSSNLNLTLTLSNNILLAPVGSGTNSFEVNTTDNLVLNGVISGTGGIGKGQVAGTTGTLTLGGSNTYSGPTNIALGTLALGANEVIPNSSAVNVTAGASMYLNGHTETIGSLLGAGTVDTGTGGTLIVGADNTAATYSGALQGSGGVTKIGTGSQTFSGSNTYTGLTTVKAGNLALTGALAQGRVITGGGADIQGGRMVFSDNSQAATIKGLLKTSFQNNGFNNTNQIRSTTATSTRGLGYVDNGTTFTVGYTYYGDTNLNGTVDTADFTAMSQHFGNTNLATAGSPTWSEGDFNYDGVINALDFNAIATNFGATPALTAPPALGSVVPEPASLALVCLGAGLLKRRARRR